MVPLVLQFFGLGIVSVLTLLSLQQLCVTSVHEKRVWQRYLLVINGLTELIVLIFNVLSYLNNNKIIYYNLMTRLSIGISIFFTILLSHKFTLYILTNLYQSKLGRMHAPIWLIWTLRFGTMILLVLLILSYAIAFHEGKLEKIYYFNFTLDIIFIICLLLVTSTISYVSRQFYLMISFLHKQYKQNHKRILSKNININTKNNSFEILNKNKDTKLLNSLLKEAINIDRIIYVLSITTIIFGFSVWNQARNEKLTNNVTTEVFKNIYEYIVHLLFITFKLVLMSIWLYKPKSCLFIKCCNKSNIYDNELIFWVLCRCFKNKHNLYDSYSQIKQIKVHKNFFKETFDEKQEHFGRIKSILSEAELINKHTLSLQKDIHTLTPNGYIDNDNDSNYVDFTEAVKASNNNNNNNNNNSNRMKHGMQLSIDLNTVELNPNYPMNPKTVSNSHLTPHDLPTMLDHSFGPSESLFDLETNTPSPVSIITSQKNSPKLTPKPTP